MTYLVSPYLVTTRIRGLWEANVFNRVCLSVCSQGSSHMGPPGPTPFKLLKLVPWE